MSDIDDEHDESETDRTILLEEAHLAHVQDLRRHHRTLVWVILLLLVVHALDALALLTLAKRMRVLNLRNPPSAAPVAGEFIGACSHEKPSRAVPIFTAREEDAL